jgi:CO/xanthine dehydrogenase FAD-binding subunit
VWRSERGVTARLAAGGIAATPVLLPTQPGAGDAGWIDATARRAAADAPVEQNERISADYRRELVEALARDALADALERMP